MGGAWGGGVSRGVVLLAGWGLSVCPPSAMHGSWPEEVIDYRLTERQGRRVEAPQ